MKKMLPINIAATVGLVFVIANSDTLYSAIKGHTTDIVERVTVEDETVAGLAVAYGDFREANQTHPTCLLYTSPSPRDS